MHFSVTCNTKQNTCENTDLIFGIHLIKNAAFCLFKKNFKIYVSFLWGYYIQFTRWLELRKLWDKPVM